MFPNHARREQTLCRLRSLRLEQLENRLCFSGPSLATAAADDVVLIASPSEGDLSQAPIVGTAGSAEVPSLAIGEGEADFSPAVESINRFAFDLYQHFQRQDGNLFLSPMSIATALAMTYGGANGETASQMADVLHLGADPGVHEAFRALLETLDPSQGSQPFVLDVANALWPQEGFRFREEFLQFIQAQYGGESQALDYGSDTEGARGIINAWVEQQTHDKIQDLIPPGVLDAMTRLVLTNAIYFKGQWATQFDPEETRERPFHLESGEAVDVPMMYLRSEFRYMEQDGFQVLEMPYEGDDLSMVILLPQETTGVEDLSEGTLASVDNWLASESGQLEIIVRLPKFETTVSSSLNGVLMGMGMPLAFDQGAADFSGMAELAPGERLFINAVLHKAFVEVNEEGTEAAAATGVVMGLTCFAAGTPVLTAEGEKPIEQVRPGDCVLSRDERNVEGAIERKPVEEVFVREGEILSLRAGGYVIRTTCEHPFCVRDRGWIAAGELQAGDLLATDNGRWVEVEDVVRTGQRETVYNLRVADYHTYFVGCRAWGFGLWVHNSYWGPPLEFNADHPFHFYIRHNETGAMLFLGRITDPLQVENSVAPQVSGDSGEGSGTPVTEPSWTNAANPYDVNGRDGVTPLDVLLIINYINAHSDLALPVSPPPASPYYDVNGDGLCTANDVLQVIARINGGGMGVGEAEFVMGLMESPNAARNPAPSLFSQIGSSQSDDDLSLSFPDLDGVLSTVAPHIAKRSPAFPKQPGF